MRVELVELLRAREPCHPSRFVLLESNCDSNVRIEVRGNPWWLENPPHAMDEKITFFFEGITDGFLGADAFTADTFEEDLETFDVRPLSEHEWANGANCEVFCTSPLSTPWDVYVSLHDFLLSVDCPFGPERYLNLGNAGSLSGFAAITSSKSYLACRGPEAVCNVVCTALKKCGTEFNIVSGKDLSSGLICVQFGGTHLICRSAYAIFDG